MVLFERHLSVHESKGTRRQSENFHYYHRQLPRKYVYFCATVEVIILRVISDATKKYHNKKPLKMDALALPSFAVNT